MTRVYYCHCFSLKWRVFPAVTWIKYSHKHDSTGYQNQQHELEAEFLYLLAFPRERCCLSIFEGLTSPVVNFRCSPRFFLSTSKVLFIFLRKAGYHLGSRRALRQNRMINKRLFLEGKCFSLWLSLRCQLWKVICGEAQSCFGWI